MQMCRYSCKTWFHFFQFTPAFNSQVLTTFVMSKRDNTFEHNIQLDILIARSGPSFFLSYAIQSTSTKGKDFYFKAKLLASFEIPFEHHLGCNNTSLLWLHSVTCHSAPSQTTCARILQNRHRRAPTPILTNASEQSRPSATRAVLVCGFSYSSRNPRNGGWPHARPHRPSEEQSYAKSRSAPTGARILESLTSLVSTKIEGFTELLYSCGSDTDPCHFCPSLTHSFEYCLWGIFLFAVKKYLGKFSRPSPSRWIFMQNYFM